MQSKTILAITVLATLNTMANAQDKSSEKDVLTIYKGDHSYKQVSVAGKTTEFYVDDKRVADNETRHYDSLIQVMRSDVDEQNRDLAISNEESERDEEQATRDREQADRDRQQADRDREQANRDRVRDQEQAARDREQAVRDREQADRERAQAETDRAQGERDRIQSQRDREQGERDRAEGERDRERAKEDMARMRELIDFLVDKKIVADKAHLSSLVLTDTALYVNGVKQPNEIHERLREKYSDWARYGVAYGDADASGVHMHIDLRGGDCCQ